MKSTELRIGNYVNTLDGILKVDGIGDYVLIEKYAYSFSDIKPIPLTEEILLKCGFVKGLNEYNIMRFNIFKPVDYVGYLFCEGNLVLREIKYLHTLQNLYFALTNQELQINL